MSKRLNNVMSTLNIGLDTVYDFLRGKPELGTVNNLTPNSKITDEQYDALKKRYQRFGNIKESANSVFSRIRERRRPSKTKREKKDTTRISFSENNGLASIKQETYLAKIDETELEHTKVDTTTDKEEIEIFLGELDFTKHKIVYWLNGIKFVLRNKQISSEFDKYRADFENIRTSILLNFHTGSFQFVKTDLLSSLIQTFQEIERENKEKKKSNKKKKEEKSTSKPKEDPTKVKSKKEKEESNNLNQKRSKAKNDIRQKVEKSEKSTEEVKLSISLSGFRFYKSLAIITYKGKSYSSYINKSEKKLLLSLNKTRIIPIVITTGKTFKFGIRISELLENVDSKIQPTNYQPLQQQKTLLGIENIEFQEHYYLVWIIRQGKIDTSITPLRVSDSNSSPCLRLIHKYFSDRFPKGIEIVYDNKRVISLTKAYNLNSYIKVLNAKIYEYGEWWEEVQNDRKMPLASCRKTPLTQIHKDMSLRNCYLDYLAGMPSQKTAMKVYEVRQNQQEDVFIFTITIQNGCYAIIFENVSFTATATWVFIVKEDCYEECVNRIFDYFTNYELHNKRLSLTKLINPPQKFKAEEYYKIMHDEPKGWIRRLNGILVREIPLNRIQFNQGLHIAEEIDSRSSSPEKIKVQHLHNELMRRLYYHLCQQYGEKNVGTENHIGTKKIDVVVKTEGGYNIYEIKTDKEPRNCVREAMGQILDYAFFECGDIINKMVIVGVTTESKEVNTYLAKFREKNSLEIYYTAI